MSLSQEYNRTFNGFRKVSAANGFPLPFIGHIFNIHSFIEKTKVQAPIAAISVQEIKIGGLQEVFQGGRLGTYAPKSGGMLALTKDFMIFINAFDNKFRALPRKDLVVTKLRDTRPNYEFPSNSLPPISGFVLHSEMAELNAGIGEGSVHLVDGYQPSDIRGDFRSHRLEKFLMFSGHYSPKPVVRAPETSTAKPPAPPLPRL